MKRLHEATHEEVIAYNLRDDGQAVTIFEQVQPYRVQKARSFVRAVLNNYTTRAIIIEPGCSSGDVSGFFSNEHDVCGIDVVPAAVQATRSRWPRMNVLHAQAEDIAPVDCDILVLCEFLEHITDPVDFVQRWLPLAKHVVIGHPLNDLGYEPGHVWSYTYEDYLNWFVLGGHQMVETHLFAMDPFPEMVLGLGRRIVT